MILPVGVEMNMVLLYQIPKEKLRKLRVILLQLGLGAKVVEPEEYGLPIGALAGLEDMDGTSQASESESPFYGEMLVMCGLSPQQFSAFLNALRQNRCPVALKAVLTETNAAWSSYRLHRELAAEHEALKKVKPENAAKNSRHP